MQERRSSQIRIKTNTMYQYLFQNIEDFAMELNYPFVSSTSPIFIPRKHTKLKYADHKRMKAKRKNKSNR